MTNKAPISNDQCPSQHPLHLVIGNWSLIGHRGLVIAHFRRRLGSVLILVVALLVLMALIGTAFIVTARTDRIAARLHAHNVQADMAVQSAVNMVTAELSADLFGPSGSQQFSFIRRRRCFPSTSTASTRRCG